MYSLFEEARKFYLEEPREERVEIEFQKKGKGKVWIFKGVGREGEQTIVFSVHSNEDNSGGKKLKTADGVKIFNDEQLLKKEIFETLRIRKQDILTKR